MRKICLITSEESFLTNYGAALQGYALYNFMRRQNYDVNIFRYIGGRFYEAEQKKEGFFQIIKKYSLKEIYIKCLFRVAKCVCSKQLKKQRKLFQQFQEKHMTFYEGKRLGWNELNSDSSYPDADIYVCGSDQIWNPYFKNGYNDPGYFLAFVPECKKKIAYAPSFGVQDIPESAQGNLQKLLSTFSYLSVREESGAQIIKKYTNLSPEVLLDPTLLLEENEWEDLAKMLPQTPDDYILCYRFGNSLKVNKAIHKIAKTLNLPILTLPLSGISYLSFKEKRIYEAGPQEFIGLIKNATLVCTDSFHATVFSIIMETPFITFLRSTEVSKGEGMNSRVINLLKKCELENRIYCENMEINSKEITSMDFKTAKENIKKERSYSREWLVKALKG